MAITVVQTQTLATGSNTSAETVTLTSTTAGNCIVVCVTSSGGATVSSITLGGSAGNFALAKQTAVFYDAEIWVDPNCAGGQTSLVVNFTSTTWPVGIIVYEVSGLATSSVVDKTAGQDSGPGTSWTTGSTATTANANEIWIGVVFDQNGVISGPAAFTNTTLTTLHTNDSQAGYEIVSSTGAAAYAGTMASGYADSAIVTLLPSVTNVNVNLTTAQVNVAAKNPGIQPGPITLPVARITVSALSPAARVSVPLAVAQVNIHAYPLVLPLILPTAQVTVKAWPPTVSIPVTVALPVARVTVTAYPVSLPRQLLVSIAARSGTDDYGNIYPAGFAATAGAIPGTLLNASSVPASAVDFSATSIGGVTTYVQGTAPSGSINAGSLWIDTSSGNAIYRYSSGSWTLYQFGTGSIQANSIGASEIVANSITTGQLVTNLVYAGIVNGTTITGANIVADGTSGQFLVYSGTPAAGNLIGSISGASGTDSNSNTYYQGITSYQGGNAPVIQILNGTIYLAASETQISASQQAFLEVVSAGSLYLNGGITSTVGDAPLQVYIQSRDYAGLNSGSGGLFYVGGVLGIISTYSGTSPGTPPTGHYVWADGNSRLATTNVNGSVQRITGTYGTQQGGNTNNTTSMNSLTNSYVIAANDAITGTVYRLRCGGHGTQASGSAAALSWQVFAFGLTWGGSTDNVIAAGDSFHWFFDGDLIIGGNGSSVGASFYGQFTWSAAIASTAVTRTVAMDKQVSSGVNTTGSTTIQFQAGWSTTSGSPTIVCTGASFERLGA